MSTVIDAEGVEEGGGEGLGGGGGQVGGRRSGHGVVRAWLYVASTAKI